MIHLVALLTIAAVVPDGSTAEHARRVRPRHSTAPHAPTGVTPSGLFRPYLVFPIAASVKAVATGDLNGDGRRDVALVTNEPTNPDPSNHKVHVFVQTPDGALASPVRYPLPGATAESSIDIGDLNGDGRDDVVVGGNTGIFVLTQNASGSLQPATVYPTLDSYQVKIGDFNADGRADVAGSDIATLTVGVYLQTPGGLLAGPTSHPAPHGGIHELEKGDVDGDGRDDIILISGAEQSGDTFTVIRQLPGGGFGLPTTHTVATGSGTLDGGAIADLDGDGRGDVALSIGGNQPTSAVAIVHQTTAGTLGAPVIVPSYDIPQAMESADLDGNGRSDLAVLHGPWLALGIYLQGSDGTLAAEALEPLNEGAYFGAQALALGDINGDGRPDAAIANTAAGLVVLYQKTPVDLGINATGPSSAPIAEVVRYDVRVVNHGSATATGAVATATLPSGVQFEGSTPAVCSAAGAVVSCALGSLGVGQEVIVGIDARSGVSGSQTTRFAVSADGTDGVVADNSAELVTVFMGSCSQRIQDGSFELGTGTPYWQQTSTNFGTPLCTFGTCGNGGGTAGPRTGAWWSWFGGVDVFEQASLTQNYTLPAAGTARLRFYVWIGAQSGFGDTLYVRVDGQAIFGISGLTPGFEGYTLVERDIAIFGGPGTHELRFEATTYGASVAGVTNFNLDDVSIQWCPLPTLTVSDPPTVFEGNAGSAPASFTVSLSETSAQPVTVSYATAATAAGFPATAGEDYVPAAGTITFPPGSTSNVVAVSVLGDELDEHDESLVLVLSAPAGATLADATAVATIADNDFPPVVSVGGATAAESGLAVLPVTMTPFSGRAVTVSFATANGTATAGTDYTAMAGAAVTIPPGAVGGSVLVPILADVVDETDETFTATITADFATVGNAQGVVTIDDDDGPELRVGDRTVTEPTGSTATASFDVTLSAASPQPVTLSYTTADGTATAGADYTAVSGTITFPPGATARTVAVDVVGDAEDEPNETFQVVLANVVDAAPADPTANGLIVDDDRGVIALAGELSHGTARTSDLASTPGPARHLYLLTRPATSSWEVMVDAASGDVGIGSGPSLARLAPDLSTVIQTSLPVGTGSARRLAVVNTAALPATDYVEVRSAGCSTDCGADDVYRVTARETTLAAPRFNNVGGQVTVLVLQERAYSPVQGTVWFWSPAGALLGSHPFALAPQQSLVLNTTTVPGVAGQGGAVTVTHDGRYGGLVGKAVALDPAAGFSFDTPLETRRR